MSNPRIYLIAKPSFDMQELQRFLDERNLGWLSSDGATASEHIVEVCGRICYMSFSDNSSEITHPNEKYIENLIQKGHESVLEHATWTFIVDRVSRAFTHQLVRHRVGFAFSQLSQQYHDESNAEFVNPAGLSSEASQLWSEATQETLRAYKKMLQLLDKNREVNFEEKRSIRSAARSILPNSTETTIAITANARAIRHFISTRGAIIGDVEMRLVSAELLKIVRQDAPSLFLDFETNKHKDGWPITTMID